MFQRNRKLLKFNNSGCKWLNKKLAQKLLKSLLDSGFQKLREIRKLYKITLEL